MNLSQNSKYSLFAPFFSFFNPASWSTFSSMSCEAGLKTVKKFIKNQTFIISG